MSYVLQQHVPHPAPCCELCCGWTGCERKEGNTVHLQDQERVQRWLDEGPFEEEKEAEEEQHEESSEEQEEEEEEEEEPAPPVKACRARVVLLFWQFGAPALQTKPPRPLPEVGCWLCLMPPAFCATKDLMAFFRAPGLLPKLDPCLPSRLVLVQTPRKRAPAPARASKRAAAKRLEGGDNEVRGPGGDSSQPAGSKGA